MKPGETTFLGLPLSPFGPLNAALTRLDGYLELTEYQTSVEAVGSQLISAGASAVILTTTFTIRVGFAVAVARGDIGDGLHVRTQVFAPATAANDVRVRVYNSTAGDLTLPALTWVIGAFKLNP